jgi:hypothetical protein
VEQLEEEILLWRSSIEFLMDRMNLQLSDLPAGWGARGDMSLSPARLKNLHVDVALW